MEESPHTAAIANRLGLIWIGVFLLCGTTAASLAAFTLLWPKTPLSRSWRLNPAAYAQLAPHGRVVGPLFALLGAALLCAAVGWFRRRLWGWRLTVAILCIQVLGDLVNCVRGDFVHGGFGLAIGGLMLLYLLQPRIRSSFNSLVH